MPHLALTLSRAIRRRENSIFRAILLLAGFVAAMPALLTSGCAGHSGRLEAEAMAETSNLQPAHWIRAVPIVEVRSGGEAQTIDLAAYYGGLKKATTVKRPLNEPLAPIEAEIVASPLDGRPTALRIRGEGEASARRLIRVRLEFEDLPVIEAVVVAHFTHVPRVKFAYRPKKKNVKQISVAGSFNGWNAEADPLSDEDGDGVFEAEVNASPGRHVYKFVVDGQWISDPKNTKRESDGFGGHNSVLTVKGRLDDASLRLAPLPDFAKKDANAAAFVLTSSDGARETKPDAIRGVAVMAGNRILGAAGAPFKRHILPRRSVAVEIEKGGVVRLKRLGAIDDAAPDGIVRVMGLTENEEWIDAVFYRRPAEFMQPEWRGRVIYFAMTDRFADGDPKNNNPLKDRRLKKIVNYHGGDWIGLRKKIEEGYFKDLGVGAVWISAANRQPEKAQKESVGEGHYFTGYHGYWPVSPTETNPHFGTMKQLRRLVEAAHKHDLLILLDLVTNHVHKEHPWHKKHPEWFGPLTLEDGTKNIRKFDEHPFTTWFDAFLPAFDYEANPEAVEAMTKNAVWWVKQTGVDGFRQDAVKHVQPALWRAMTRRLRGEIELPERRRFYQVGETISDRATIMKFVSGEMLDGQFDFPLYWPLRETLGAYARGLNELVGEIEASRREYEPEFMMSPLIGNHDVSRFMAWADGDLVPGAGQNETELGWKGSFTVDSDEAYRRLQLAHAFLLSMPGNPMLYYGDEIGLTGAGDPDNRRPLRFEPDLNDNERATLENLRALGRLRRESLALRFGDYQTLYATPNVLAFARVAVGRSDAPDQAVVTVINRGKRAQRLSIELPENLRDAASARALYSRSGEGEATVGKGRLEIAAPRQDAAIVEIGR